MQSPCPECDAVCDADAETCPECKASLTVLCFCGAVLPRAHSRCEACGSELAAPTPKQPSRRRRRLLGVAIGLFVVAAIGTAVVLNRRSAWQPRPIDRARALRDAEDHAGAVLAYERVLVNAPSDKDANLELASCLQRMGRPASEYLPYMLTASAGSPDDAALRAELARELTLLGRIEEAHGHAAAAAEAGAATPHVYQLLAWLELTRSDPSPARALAATERARAAGADSAVLDLVEAEARLLLRSDLLDGERSAELARAVTAVQKALEALPTDGAADLSQILLRARNALLLRHFDAAAAESTRALQAGGGPPETSSTWRTLLTIRGIARLETGDTAAARSDFESALRAPGGRPAARHLGRMLHLSDSVARAIPVLDDLAGAGGLPDAGLALAEALRAGGRTERALERARELVATSPDDRDYGLLLAGLLAERDETDEALALYERLVAQDPEALEPRLGLLAQRLVRADTHDADVPALLDEAQRLRAEHPQDGRVTTVALDAMLLAGRIDEACAVAREAVRCHPHEPALRALLAAALERVPDTAALLEAVAVWRQAREMTPRDVTLHAREATAWMRAGRAVEAGQVCAEGLGLEPGNVPLLRLQATAEEHRGRWPHAAGVLKRLLSAEPSDGTALRLIDALHRCDRTVEADRIARNFQPRGDVEDYRRSLAVLRALHVDGLTAALEAAGDAAGVKLELLLISDDVPGAVRLAVEALAGDTDRAAIFESAIVLYLGEASQSEALGGPLASAAERLDPDAAGNARLRLLASGALGATGGDFGSTVRPLTEAVLADAGDLTARFVLGVGLCETGEPASGLAVLREVVGSGRSYPTQRRELLRRLDTAARIEPDPVRQLALLRERATLAPRDATAVERLITAEMRLGNIADGLALVSSLLQRGDLEPETIGRLRITHAQLLAAAGNWDAARAEIRRLDPDARRLPAARTVLAYAAIGEGRLDEAQTELEPLLAQEDVRSLAAVAFVWLRVRRGELNDAARFWHSWQADGPLDPLACVRSAEVLVGAHDPGLGRAILETGFALDPRNQAVRGALQRVAAEYQSASEAIDVAQRIAAVCEADEPRAAVMIQAAAEIRLAGDAERGKRLAHTVASDLRATPLEAASARMLVAEADLRLGRFDSALERAEAERSAWEGTEPASWDQRAVAARVHFVLGAVHMRKVRMAQAATAFERSLSYDAGDLAALNNLVWCRARSGSPSTDTLDLARSLTTRAPHRPEFWDTHAVAAVALGEPDEASRCWREAQTLLRDRGANAADPLYQRTMGRFVDHLRASGQTEAADELAAELETIERTER